jgi:hypothetical protein
MSRVHDAVRRLEHTRQSAGSGGALSNLVGALIDELVDEVPDDAYLETVRADLQAASRSYETGKKEDIAIRFYLATRALLHEHALLQDRLRKAESSGITQVPEPGEIENSSLATQ